MKCPHCGGEVALEDKFCPYCGQPNEQSIRHRKDMERFQKAFRDTEKSVEKKMKHYVHVMPRLIVVLVLLVVSIVTVVIGSHAWDFYDNSKRRAAERNAAETRAVLDAYLEERDYKSFVSYVEYHYLSMYRGEFTDYSNIYSSAYDYSMLLIRMEQLFLNRDRESWLKNEASGDIRILSSTIADFFETQGYMESRELTEKDVKCLQDMRGLVEGMLRVYLGLDEEGLKEFLAMSENRQSFYLEEVILGA